MTQLFHRKTFFRFFLFVLLAVLATLTSLHAQEGVPKSLYEQTSEMGTTIISYQRDIAAVQDFYSPQTGSYFRGNNNSYASPEQRDRFIKVNNDYLIKLKNLGFDEFSVYGKVDYIMLKKQINSNLEKLKSEEVQYNQIRKYIPFANEIYELEKQRRRGKYMEGAKVAAQITRIMKSVDSASTAFKKNIELQPIELTTTNRAIVGLVARLKNYTDFYVNYDPEFTWWVPKPAEELSASLTKYAQNFTLKVEKPTGNHITGTPIGKDELQRQITAEMLPYTPEELIRLAEKEFAFCDKELLQASKDMGFGTDWKKAQEKVKNSYVPVGKQPELIVKLQDDALDFIKLNNLMDIPEIANETWGMIMMTADRQLVNPFFTGGREISISYPTQTMSQEDKLMSMRGNNPYFSRATVHHELVPGHHLQYYMNSRYKSYRNTFSTPF
ncbi:MAG: DUF885 family protein, partial [Pedobacter sp.]